MVKLHCVNELVGTCSKEKPSSRVRAGLLALMLSLFTGRGYAEVIVAATYSYSVESYGHFALGKPHEYAVVSASTDQGRILRFELPADLVFEDLAPRIVYVKTGAAPQLLTIVSGRDGGARLMLLQQDGDRLIPAAQSSPIGMSMRWMNPVSVADLDGDGHVEIAAVITPHVGGTLKIFRIDGYRLVEIAALGNFSNHVYGTSELGLSTVAKVAGRIILVVPDFTRTRLRLIAFSEGRLVELGNCMLDEPLKSALKPLGDGLIHIDGSPRPLVLDLKKFLD